MATLPGLRVGLTLDSATFVAETRRVNDSVNRMGRNVAQQNAQMQRGFASVASAAKALVATLGTLVTVAGAVRLGTLAKDALDAAGNLGEMATAAGVTTRQLQAMQLAGVQVGVSSEQMVRALGQFGVRVGEARQGTGELVDTLERYGIATANSSGKVRSSIDILGDLANAVQRAGSEQDRLSIVADAFGSRVGPKLLPLLTEGADGFRQWAEQAEAAGLILDDEFIAAADRASDGIATLQFAVSKGFEIGVVETFASAVSVTADQIERARQVGEAFGRAMGTVMDLAIDAMRSLQPFFETTVREFNALAGLLQRFFDFVGVPFNFAAEAAEGASAAIKPLEVDIHKAVVRTEQLAAATDKLTGAQKRLAEAGRILTRTSAQEQRFDHAAEQAKKAAEAMEAIAREREKAAAEQLRMQERQAAETERLLAQPFENFLRSVQSSTADTFETIFSGGVESFSDLFETAKQLATRFAAEMAALLVFNPRMVLGTAGAFGAGGVPGTAGGPSLASAFGFGGSTAGGGPISLSQPITGVPAGQQIGSSFNFNGAGFAAGGLAGFGVGTGVGTAVGGNATSAAIGSGLGAIAGGIAGSFIPVVGTALGAFAGGALGGVLGGLLGGGGGSDKTSGGFSGRLGSANTFGDSAIGSAVRKVDDAILGMLNARQEQIVRQLKLPSHSISVSGGLSGSDLEAITARRLGPTARALGFNQREVLRGDADQALQNFATALETKRAIEDLTGAVTQFERQTEDLENTFADLEAKAKRFGISTDGMAEAQQRATEELRKAQDASIGALRTPFEALRDPLEALKAQLQFTSLNPAEQFRFVQEDFRRVAEEALAGDISAIQDFAGAASLFIQHADQFGASPLASGSRAEVASLTEQLLDRIATSQGAAFEGVEDILDRIHRDQADKLDRLIELTQQQIRELQRGKTPI